MRPTTDIARSDDTWGTIRALLPYLWPKNALGLRVRVVLAACALILAKVAVVLIPIVYSRAVNDLSPKAGPLVVPPR